VARAVSGCGIRGATDGIPVALDNIVTAGRVAAELQVQPSPLTEAARSAAASSREPSHSDAGTAGACGQLAASQQASRNVFCRVSRRRVAQKALGLGVFRVLLWGFAGRQSQVVCWPTIAFGRRQGGPYFRRHYSFVLSLPTRKAAAIFRVNRVGDRTIGGFILFHMVSEQDSRAGSQENLSFGGTCVFVGVCP
jgi:hypothetical protein